MAKFSGPSWPTGDGEMAGRIRAHDWSATPLGPIAGWPQALRAAVDLMLPNGFPMVALWGPELVQVYNDGYRRIMAGRHPAGLGQPTRDCWPEVWHINLPIYARALAGVTLTFEDKLYPIIRHGRLEDAWFTLSYSPLRDHEDRVAGVLVTLFETTGRHVAEATLRESEERFRALADVAPQLAWSGVGPDTDFYNRRWHDYTGLGEAASRERNAWHAVVHPDDLPTVRERGEESLRTGEPFEAEYRLRLADGGYRWHIARAHRVPGSERWVGAATDIHDLKTTEGRLRASEERLRLSLQAGRAYTFEIDLGTRRIEQSGDARAVLGFAMPEGEAERFAMVHPDDRARAAAAFEEAASGRKPYRIEHRLIAPGTGATVWVRVEADVFGPNRGRLVGFVQNVTAEKAAEAALQAGEERFRSFAENSADAIWIADAEGRRLEYLSPAFEVIWGEPRGGVMADLGRWAELVHPDDRERASEGMARLRAGEAFTQEYRIVRPCDGAVRWIEDTGFPIRDTADGKVRRIGGIAQDVTGRKETESAVRASRRRLRALVEGIPQLVWRAAGGGDWTWSSPQWGGYTGQPEAASHGRGWLEALHPEDREPAMAAWRVAEARCGYEAEYRVFHAGEGRHRWFRTRAAPVRDEEGHIVEWLGTSTDVDELRQLQEEQRLLVAELQHRTRNLLAVVRSVAGQTIRASDSLPTFQARFDERLGALSRVQGLLSRPDWQRITLGDLVGLELDALGAAGRVTLDGPEVPLRPSAVQILALAVHELATNARKHGALAGDQGRLAVSWRVHKEDGDGTRLALDWVEEGAEPPLDPAAPLRRGFGRELIERALPYALGARTRFQMDSGGVRCMVDLPLGNPGGRDRSR